VKTEIERLLETRQKDFDTHLGMLGKPRVCNGEIDASVRLHFVLSDASGEPRVRELASMLVGYITKYCFDATKRKDLDEVDRNLLFVEARDLFRKAGKSGQAGELLIYFLLEAVLKAPQALRKMVITTNPKDERKGSDGMHFSWNQDLEILELYFAESKVWNDFGAALSDALASVEKFHNDGLKQHEFNLFSSQFKILDDQLQGRILSYINGENVTKTRITHACLVGFDWNEYLCLGDGRRKDFIREFEERYSSWADDAVTKVETKLAAFSLRHLRFEFFFLPFKSVEEFRTLFEAALRG
jgi:hypothetical protein